MNIEFMAGYFRQDSRSTFLVLHKTMRKKDRMPIVFVCVGADDSDRRRPEADEKAGVDAGAVGKALIELWFHEQALKLCEKRDAAKCVDAAAESFCAMAEGDLLLAVLFCMGEECFYAWQGEAEICLLNHCLGRLHVRKLTMPSEELICRRAVLEPGVGVLLGTRSFHEQVSERFHREALEVYDMRGQGQVERHLREVSEEAARRGAEDIATALVVSRKPDSTVYITRLEAILRQSGYTSPRLIGHGAFGHVYCVTVSGGHGKAACKMAEGVEERRLLRREAQLQSGLSHPLFAHYLRCIEETDCTLLLMEYVRGKDLGEILRRKTFSRKKAIGTAVQLAEGLLYLHRLPEPMLYRDLKPENIRIGSDGRVKLLDLGCVCKLSEAGKSRAGSRGYAAPEQLGENGVPGFYSDVYALGRVIQSMLAGGKISSELKRFLIRCTDERPENRPADMEAVLKELKGFITR